MEEKSVAHPYDRHLRWLGSAFVRLVTEQCIQRKGSLREWKAYDIDLMLYYTGDGPCRDSADIANRAFGFTTPRFDYERGEWIGKREPDFIPESFVDKWTAVLREYAVRYAASSCLTPDLSGTSVLIPECGRPCRN
jgi:hypothetical protein